MLIVFPLIWTPVLSLCGSYLGPVCCSGTYWNDETSSCEKCPLGYQDINCSRICSYPTFGKRCQDICNCKPSECDFRFGCKIFDDFPPQKTFNSTPHIITTSKITEMASSGYPTFIKGFSNSVFYIILAFVVLFGLFVVIYFYKHCVKRTEVPHSKKEENFSSQFVEYKSLYRESHQHPPIENATDPMYLEPVTNVHYDEINNFH